MLLMPIKNGRVMKITRPFCVVAALFFSPLLAAKTDSLLEFQALADAGQPQLALALAERAADPELEKASIEWLFQVRLWSQLESRLAELARSENGERRLWGKQLQVKMALQRGQGERALALLRELLWDKTESAEPIDQRKPLHIKWRLQIVQAYLLMRKSTDAETAWRRFQLDYPEQADKESLLQARLLLLAGRFAELLKQSPPTSAQGLALRALAQLKSEQKSPATLFHGFKKRAESKSNSDQQRGYFWALAAKAAQAQGELVNIALASDFALHFQVLLPTDSLLQISSDEVWQAYLDYGQRLGNEENLLIGEDDAWFAAVQAALPLHPIRAKSLLAVVALLGGSEAARAQAHWQLLALLKGDGLGRAQIKALYLDSKRFPASSDIPLVVRLHLQQQALDDSDVVLAKRLAKPLQPLPEGFADLDLSLLHVSSLLLVDELALASESLTELLAFESPWTLPQRLRLHGFVADLLARERADLAERLLNQMGVLAQTHSERMQWWFELASVKRAQGELLCAARFYLLAAKLSGGARAWQRKTLRQAAQTLKQAGLLGDARRVYRRLLSMTSDSFQRAELIAEME